MDHRAIGRFHADAIARILNGASPRSLDQVFEEEVVVSINLNTAERIGFTPSRSLLREAKVVGADAADDRAGPTAVTAVQTHAGLRGATVRGER